MALNIADTLGLDKVDSDVNSIPDGRYDGKVSNSALVYVDSKDELSHVIEYTVTDGEFKGRRRSEWFTLYGQPRLADGERPKKGEVNANDIESVTPIMSDEAKPWYKARLEALGVQGGALNDVSTLKGTPVTFGVKRSKGYVNVNFAEKRGATDSTPVNVDTTPQATTPSDGLDF